MKRYITVSCSVAVSILIGAASASAQLWGRPRVPLAGVCFYEDMNYGGRYFCAAVGTSMEHVSGGADDEISSIRVFGNAEVTVYRDSAFHGSSRRFDINVSDLRSAGFNDRVTSYRVSYRGYSQGGNWGGAYGGGSHGGGRWGDNDDEDRHRRHGGNNWGGAFGGGAFGGGYSGGGLEVFTDSRFRGRRLTLYGNTPDMSAIGMKETISSLRVPSGGMWQVCTKEDYRGRCQVVSSDMPDLRLGDWDDEIASARRLR